MSDKQSPEKSDDKKEEEEEDWENEPYSLEEVAKMKEQTIQDEKERREGKEDSQIASEDEEDKKEDEDSEDEEDSKYIQPIMDGRNITFKTRILNQYLICGLCMGYYRDAMTIKECLHTFCKSCIYKYFVDCGSECPQCDVRLGTNPYELIKYDRQIQAIVDKIFPDIEIKDSESEREFYKKTGIDYQEPIPPAGKHGDSSSLKRPNPSEDSAPSEEPSTPTVTKKLKKSDVEKKFYADEVAFELTLDELEKDDMLKKLDRPFIRTSAKVTILHLKKYLKKKLETPVKDVEITFRGEVLGNEHSLEYIWKTRGVSDSKTPNFKYRLRKHEHGILQE